VPAFGISAFQAGGAAEEKVKAWEARYLLINHVAHELNNPLAAMTFALHLLNTHTLIYPTTPKNSSMMPLTCSTASGHLRASP
jgi:signal transduction histidine kinase